MIRTGGPSRPADTKVAVVATSGSMVGKRFRVLAADGRTVLTAKVTRAPGKPAPWKRAGLADLSSVTAPGSYTVRLGRLRSRPWVIADDAGQDAIATMLQFFAAQSDGNEPSPIHGPSHLNDADVASGAYTGQHFDLTGGWMDAGDTIKFTQTTGYVAMALQAAARLDPAQADALNAASDVGIRWLVKAHPRPDLFIGQVGDERDHALPFRDPAGDDQLPDPGVGTRLAYPSTGSDLAGKAAAALAMASQRYSGDVHDLLLQQAREWFAAGQSTNAVAQLPGAFYPSASFEDDMAAGAAELYRATGDQQYLASALDYLKGANFYGAFTWDEVAGFPAADICGLLGAPPLGDSGACDQAMAGLTLGGSDAIGRSLVGPLNPAGYLQWGSSAANAASGLLALFGGAASGRRVAVGARDFLLGRNPWGASFVVGYGPRSPRHPHTWASVFGPAEPVGAVVGGPAPASQVAEQKLKVRRNVFHRPGAVSTDDKDNYVTSEPAIDYTAASILLLAALGR